MFNIQKNQKSDVGVGRKEMNEKEKIIRTAICKAGTVSELSRQIKVSKTAIYKLLNIKDRKMSISTLIKLEEYLTDEKN
jgi:hypothetical protein